MRRLIPLTALRQTRQYRPKMAISTALLATPTKSRGPSYGGGFGIAERQGEIGAFRNDRARIDQRLIARASAHVFRYMFLEDMGMQPFSVPEKGAERQRDLPMLVAFRAGWERARIAQDVAPVLDELRHCMERMVERQSTSNRRHDATYVDLQVTVMQATRLISHSDSLIRWSILLICTI
jgi:hypothetical protein